MSGTTRAHFVAGDVLRTARLQGWQNLMKSGRIIGRSTRGIVYEYAHGAIYVTSWKMLTGRYCVGVDLDMAAALTETCTVIADVYDVSGAAVIASSTLTLTNSETTGGYVPAWFYLDASASIFTVGAVRIRFRVSIVGGASTNRFKNMVVWEAPSYWPEDGSASSPYRPLSGDVSELDVNNSPVGDVENNWP